MAMVVRAYPLSAGLSDLKNFGDSLSVEQRRETDAFFRRHGVMHESWHVQRIGGVEWVICCTQVRDRVATAETYGKSMEAFDRWFKEQISMLTSVDPNETPLGLPSEQVFAWDDKARAGADPL